MLDADGVMMLLPAKAGGTDYRLGSDCPADDHDHLHLWADTLTKETEDGVTFWRSTGHPIQYASGKPDGTSHRITIIAGGGAQAYNWKTGAIEHGFCGNAHDLSAFEATIYCRLHTPTGTHESVSWIIRGGEHDAQRPEDASCIGISLRDAPSQNSVFKELTHPVYGYSDVRPKFDYTKASGKWLGIKVVSYIDSTTTVRNLMYLDTDPYSSAGSKKNDWRPYLEWTDTQGVVMGAYAQAALWAGWMNTFRVDGWTLVDFSIVSAREIVLP
ncbi:hypothetical protein [Rhodococcus tukisamuensis]|uniref:Uncharacterized protein n=1 Tax=Rhodococcus tukisamuensis TaxID=168276 RepID=A0A1G6X1M5_9NOCA|nr:hypothetical protein [Rhodococcus tukisamuensis]SDD71949.1 hypothetical protein SAMN05444580_10656 [Rhodococcus tukisamuensis]